jgi:HEAT repeat protein
MTGEMTSMIFRIAVACVILSAPVAAQAPRPASDPQIISRGWAAIAAGRFGEAVTLADGILKRKPRSHAALALKIEALSAGAQPIVALDAYEQWLPGAGRRVDDRGLLEPVAAGLLRTLATDADPVIRSKALQALTESGDSAATDALRKRSGEGDQTATFALVSSGDSSAISAVQTLVAAGTGRDVSAAIDALAEHGGISPSVMTAIVKDRVPMNRAAAARALGRSSDLNASQLLEELSRDPDPVVRRSVTLARAVRGDAKALADGREMLASEVPELRVFAAEALATTLPTESGQAVRPLLANRDGLIRFKAAAIVGRTDPAAVQSVFMEGLGDPNPLVQQEAARLATETLPGDIVLLRQLLRHADHTIVVNAAAAIIGN